jgi:hypothetical protein
MKLNVSKLIKLDIVDSDGSLKDYPELTSEQSVVIVKRIIEVSCKKQNLNQSIENYISSSGSSGLLKTFPEVFVYQIYTKYKAKMIDNELLNE